MRIINLFLSFLLIGSMVISCKNKEASEAPSKNKLIIEDTISDSPNGESVIEPRLLDKIENYLLTQFLDERDLRSMSRDERKFQAEEIDLNNDGKKEVFIKLSSTYFCGTGGCTILLLDDELNLITKFTVADTPIYVKKSSGNYADLYLRSAGKWRELTYENGSYPTNPSMVKAVEEPSKDEVDILFPDTNQPIKYDF